MRNQNNWNGTKQIRRTTCFHISQIFIILRFSVSNSNLALRTIKKENFYKTTKCNACQRINVFNAKCKGKRKRQTNITYMQPNNNKQKFNKAVPIKWNQMKTENKTSNKNQTCSEIFCVSLYKTFTTTKKTRSKKKSTERRTFFLQLTWRMQKCKEKNITICRVQVLICI